MGIHRFSLSLISIVFAAVEVLIGMMILLKLFGAFSSAPFVRWVYQTTDPLLYPFSGMFPSPRIEGGFIIEFSAVFGLIAYTLVGSFISEILETVEHRAEIRERGRTREE